MKNPQSVLAHLILCGTSGWALKTTGTSYPWALGTFALLFGHGAVGMVRYGLENPDEKIVKAFDTSLVTAESIALPLVNVDVYLENNMRKEIAYAHAASAAVPVGMQVASENNDRVIDLIVLGNIASLVFVAVSKEHAWAAGLAAVTTMNHFMLTRISENLDVSRADLIAIGLSLFNIFAVQCLAEIDKAP